MKKTAAPPMQFAQALHDGSLPLVGDLRRHPKKEPQQEPGDCPTPICPMDEPNELELKESLRL
jgi:hypothetical protein